MCWYFEDDNGPVLLLFVPFFFTTKLPNTSGIGIRYESIFNPKITPSYPQVLIDLLTLYYEVKYLVFKYLL